MGGPKQKQDDGKSGSDGCQESSEPWSHVDIKKRWCLSIRLNAEQSHVHKARGKAPAVFRSALQIVYLA